MNFRNNFAVQNIHNKKMNKEVKHFEQKNENERARTAREKRRRTA